MVKLQLQPTVLFELVVNRVYPNPKTRRVLGYFPEPEATRTRTFQKFINPNPKVKPAGLKNGKKREKSPNFGPDLCIKHFTLTFLHKNVF